MQPVDARAIRRFHMVADCLLVACGWVCAWWLRYSLDDVLGKPINSFHWYLSALPGIVFAWVFSCWLFGIYRSTRMKTVVDELQLLFRGVALGLLVVSSLSFFFRELEIGRFVVLIGAGFNLVSQGISRVFFHRIECRMRRSGLHDVPALIVGTGVSAIRLLQKIQDHPEIGYRVVGFLDEGADGDRKDVANRPVLGHLEELRDVAIRHGVKEVFIAMPSLGHTRMLAIVLDCEDLGIAFRVVTNLFEVLTAGTPIDLVDDLPLVRLGREQVYPLYAPVKRVIDVMGALAGLALAGPLMFWCAMRIRGGGASSAIFSQTRIGQNGEPFSMYKFRTMREDVDPYSVAPHDPSDPRITEYGAWLRATSIDELPQLFNVLKGRMSLVGPRPEMPFIVAGYDEWQRRRLGVKPGITGMWQILGRKDLPMHDNLQYDFYYIRNRSIGLDLSILLRTIGAVFSRRGAF